MYIFMLDILFLVGGLALILVGANALTDGAAAVAKRFNISDLVIGLTIVAFGTSAPEAAVSISAALKGSVDLAISNVLGSNIMNVLLILGLSSIIYPLAVKPSTMKIDIPFVFGCSVLLLLFGIMDGKLGRVEGLVFWALLAVDIVYMIKMAMSGQGEVEEIEEADESLKKLKEDEAALRKQHEEGGSLEALAVEKFGKGENDESE